MARTSRISKRRKPFFYVLTFFFICLHVNAQLSIASWNIRHLGKSKSDETISYIAKSISDFDIIAVQEVVVGPEGAKAVSKIVNQLNTKNNQWDYVLSDPTTGSSAKSERYAYIWKKNKVKIIKKPRLFIEFQDKMEREPYLFFIQYRSVNITLVNFHAPSKKDQPEKELKYLNEFDQYISGELVFLGDFNIVSKHTVFNPLKKKGYQPIFENQKTTLRHKCIKGDCLASAYDHIFFKENKLYIIDKGVVTFYSDFENLKAAQKVSDHIPVYFKIEKWN